MNIVLDWKYKDTGLLVLDYIAHNKFDTQDDIAISLGLNPKTVRRQIAKLKEQGMLIVHRFHGNNFLYLIGQDAQEKWNKFEARHIAVYRKYKFDDTITKEDSAELPLFEYELEDAENHDGYYNSDVGKDYKATEFNQAMEFSRVEAKELDEIIEGYRV